MSPVEHTSFMESTESMILLGTSKWFAKIVVKGWNLCYVTMPIDVLFN